MHVNAHLAFPGTCHEALEFYQRALGASVADVLTFANTPMAGDVPPEWRDKVVHGRLAIGETIVYVTDAPPDRYVRPAGLALTIGTTDPAEAERIFAGLAEGGTVEMPLAETFWSPRFGSLVDRFGIHWMINTEPAA
jgi:PhnB protein